MKYTKPAATNAIALKQVLNLILLGMIQRIANETGIGKMSRTFSVVSLLTSMLFAQLCGPSA